jgi:hypothetical protein
VEGLGLFRVVSICSRWGLLSRFIMSLRAGQGLTYVVTSMFAKTTLLMWLIML